MKTYGNGKKFWQSVDDPPMFQIIGEGPYSIRHKSGLVFPFTYPTLDRANDLIDNIKNKVNWDFDSFELLPYWVKVVIGEKVRDIYDRHNNEEYLS